MQFNQACHVLRGFLIETQRFHALDRQLCAHQIVVVEAHCPTRFQLTRGGLTNIVQKSGQAQGEVGGFARVAFLLEINGLFQHRQAVFVDIFVVVVFVYFQAQGRNFRQDVTGDSRAHEQFNTGTWLVGEQEFAQLFVHALC